MIRSLRRTAKRLATWLLGRLLGAFEHRPIVGPPRRVLVIRVDLRVGNVLLTTPLLRALQEGLPEAEVVALVAPSKAAILDGLVATIPFDKKLARRRPLAFLRALLALRRARFDVAIDASHWHTFSVTSAALLAWTGAPIRIAHARGAADRFANRLVPPPDTAESEVRTKLRLASPLGIEPRRIEMCTGLGRGPAAQRMADWLEDRSLRGRPLVGLAPGARKLDHRTPPQLFAALGAQARAAGADVLVLWGPGEQALAEQVAAAGEGIVAPPSDLDELAALMRRCDVVVANDTGPMHLCVACGTHCVALFRSADPIRWGHAELGQDVLVFEEGAEARALEEASVALRRALDRLRDAVARADP